MRYYILLLGICISNMLNANIETNPVESSFVYDSLINNDFSNQKIPRVFVIEDNEAIFNKLNYDYKTLLFSVCDNDMQEAYVKWRSMLLELQSVSKKLGYDMNGVKIWMQVYWNRKGQIEHIGYSIKPRSRNIPNREVFEKILIRFMQGYNMDVKSKTGFSHYTSVSFPIR